MKETLLSVPFCLDRLVGETHQGTWSRRLYSVLFSEPKTTTPLTGNLYLPFLFRFSTFTGRLHDETTVLVPITITVSEKILCYLIKGRQLYSRLKCKKEVTQNTWVLSKKRGKGKTIYVSNCYGHLLVGRSFVTELLMDISTRRNPFPFLRRGSDEDVWLSVVPVSIGQTLSLSRYRYSSESQRVESNESILWLLSGGVSKRGKNG